jgi:trigger factor
MQVTETLSQGLKRSFNVVLSATELHQRREARLVEVAKTMNLPGFRPGKVPMALVKKRYSGAVMAEVLEDSVNKATNQLMTDRGLRSATEPKVEIVTLDETKDVEFKVDLELLPDVTMPDFASISLTRHTAEPTPESLDAALAEIATRQRSTVTLEGDDVVPAETGHILTVDFLGKINGVPFEGGTASDADVEIGGSGFIPGFAEQLVGMKPGDEKIIEVTFPAEYGAADLAGKAATFDITAKALKRATTPAIDDAFAEQLGFETLEDVRKAVASSMQREYDQLSRLRIKRELLDALTKLVDFAVPESMVESEFAQIWQRIEADRAKGETDSEDAGKDEATLRGEYRAIAERRVRLGLLLAEIGRAQGVTVGADEMNRAMIREAQRYPGQEQMVIEFFRKNKEAAESLRGPIFEEKVVDFVLELAQVTDVAVTPEELARDANAVPAPADVAEPASQMAGDAA